MAPDDIACHIPLQCLKKLERSHTHGAVWFKQSSRLLTRFEEDNGTEAQLAIGDEADGILAALFNTKRQAKSVTLFAYEQDIGRAKRHPDPDVHRQRRVRAMMCVCTTEDGVCVR
jgi:hypothetical protein